MRATSLLILICTVLLKESTFGDGHKTKHNRITHKKENETIEEFTNRLFSDYHRLYRPMVDNSTGPTVVHVNIYVASFSSISVIEMDYSMDILLRQRWKDTRLQYTDYHDSISLNYMKEKLWIPDLFFRNAKAGVLHDITTPNYLIWLKPDGRILFSQKLSLKLSCPMKLWRFPMDKQVCKLEIGSYGYAMKDLVFEWLSQDNPDDNVKLNEDMILNEFDPPDFKTGSCVKNYSTTGAFTCIYVNFSLQRKFGFYLIYTYLPSVLIVVISWISYFIDFQAVPARISLGLLSVLSLITQSAATLQKMPRVSYIKAIDVWLFTCLAFVVFSLLEFAVVNVLARRQQRLSLQNDMRKIFREEMTSMKTIVSFGAGMAGLRPKSGITKSAGKSGGFNDTGNMEGGSSTSGNARASNRGQNSRRRSSEADQEESEMRKNNRMKAHRIDRLCVFAFPVCFIFFNLVYWFYFLLTPNET